MVIKTPLSSIYYKCRMITDKFEEYLKQTTLLNVKGTSEAKVNQNMHDEELLDKKHGMMGMDNGEC